MFKQKVPFFQNKTLSYFILFLIILIPALFALSVAITAGGAVPRHDYWGLISRIYTEDGFSINLSTWIRSHNGHILFVPIIFFALNAILTDGSNIGLTLVTWVFAVLQTLVLIQLLPRDIRDRRIYLMLIFALSAFSFTPSAAAGTWATGFSGVAWIGANLFSVTAIACLFQYFQSARLWWILASIVTAILGTLTYGSTLVLWISLSVGALLIMRHLWLGLGYIGCTLVVYAGYFDHVNFSTASVSNSETILFVEKIQLLYVYVTVYLGGIFTNNNHIASILGSIGLLFFIASFIYLLLRANPKRRLFLLPWSMIHLYAIGNAILTGLTRSHLGIEQAFTSRYASIPAMFWAGSIVIGVYLLYQVVAQWSRRKFLPVFAVVLLLILAMYPVGFKSAAEAAHVKSLQPLALLSLRVGVPDDVALYHAITIVPGPFVEYVPILKQYGHVPFDKADTSCGQLNQPIPTHLIRQTSPDNVSGHFDFMDRFLENGFRVAGWAHANGHLQCIVLLNEENIIRGFALPGAYRPDVAEIHGLADQHTGWLGYARPASADEQLQAYILLEGNEMWIPLDNTHSPQNPGTVNPDVYTAYYYQ